MITIVRSYYENYKAANCCESETVPRCSCASYIYILYLREINTHGMGGKREEKLNFSYFIYFI